MAFISRRKFLAISGVSALSLFLGACSSVNGQDSGSSTTGTSSNSSSSSNSSNSSSSSSPSSSSSSSESTTNEEPQHKSLVAIFSRAGENYQVGYVSEGNTQILADRIAEQTGADTFQIQTVDPYPEEYNPTLDRAQEEKNERARPQLTEIRDISDYDTIYLGYPIWWGDLPMAVYTYIESQNWNGKTIAPFCTSAGSGLNNSVQTIRNECRGATVTQGLYIDGATAQNDRNTVNTQVDAWLGQIGVA